MIYSLRSGEPSLMTGKEAVGVGLNECSTANFLGRVGRKLPSFFGVGGGEGGGDEWVARLTGTSRLWLHFDAAEAVDVCGWIVRLSSDLQVWIAVVVEIKSRKSSKGQQISSFPVTTPAKLHQNSYLDRYKLCGLPSIGENTVQPCCRLVDDKLLFVSVWWQKSSQKF